MKFRTVIYTLLLAALCMGCGGHLSMHELEHLEARMNEVPDSVRLALDSITYKGESLPHYMSMRGSAEH